MGMSKTTVSFFLPIFFSTLVICAIVLCTCAYCYKPSYLLRLQGRGRDHDLEKAPPGRILEINTVSFDVSVFIFTFILHSMPTAGSLALYIPSFHFLKFTELYERRVTDGNEPTGSCWRSSVGAPRCSFRGNRGRRSYWRLRSSPRNRRNRYYWRGTIFNYRFRRLSPINRFISAVGGFLSFVCVLLLVRPALFSGQHYFFWTSFLDHYFSFPLPPSPNRYEMGLSQLR